MMKRFFVSAAALMMAAAMVTVCAFAAPQKGGRDKANDRNGERPAEFQRENEKGDRPDMPDSGQKPSRPMNNGGFDFDDFGEKTAEKLESVTDEELKSELNSLLEEYETAAAALQSAVESKEDEQSLKSLRESTDSARKALADALKEAGIEVGGSKPKDNDGDKKPRDFDFDDFGEKTAEKLESVTDEELKAELNSLLEEYKTAAAALQAAVESKEDEQSLKSLRESTDSARKALADALKEAGIEVGGSKPKDNDGDKKPDKIKLSEPAESEPAAEQESGSGGFFSAIMNWFGNLFK